MRKFDTNVQYTKYLVLREVAREAWADTLLDNAADIPQRIAPNGSQATDCCVYKERAVLAERVRMAAGGHRDNPNIIEVINVACDECPMGGFEVTNSCRGCLAHRCMDVCPRGAISFDSRHTAHIDKSKCVNCGQCAKVCPYSAIADRKRPCINACKIKAITIGADQAASIDNSKCISCGACVYQCPFGAIMDKSFLLDVIDILKKSENNTKYKVFAVVAPSISSQFTYAKLGQVVSGLKRLGFHTVVEAALGADMVADAESRELVEKGFLTSSCCPAFVSYIEKAFPSLLQNVMTFEELQALFDSRDMDITTLPLDVLDNASYFGRIFARCGGLSDAVAQGIKEHGDTFNLKALSCDGIEECRMALLKASKGKLDANFVEGMACIGGCIGGAGCLTHGEKSKLQVDKYGMEAHEKTISDAISVLNK